MRKLLTILAVLILVLVIGVGTFRFLQSGEDVALPPGVPEPEEILQPDWCPDVEVIAAPGTWESAPGDDPIHPTANEYSFMLSITRPLQERFSPEDVKVWTLPYTAQFRSIQAQHEMSYDDSPSPCSAHTVVGTSPARSARVPAWCRPTASGVSP